MSTGSETGAVSSDPRGWSERWSPLGGVIFVIAIVFLFVFASSETGDTAAEVITYAEDKEGELVAGAVVGLISIAAVGWFLSGLHARVRRMSSQTAPALVLVGGTAFVVLVFLALAIWSAPLIDFPGDGDAEAMANAYLLIDDLGWVSLGGGGIGAALMAIAASVAALREGVLPRWLGWLGALVGLICAATIVFVGIFAWLLWILAASILMLAKRA